MIRRLINPLLTPLAILVFTVSTAQSAWLFSHVDWEKVDCEMEIIRLQDTGK